jgi:hypothetical protein
VAGPKPVRGGYSEPIDGFVQTPEKPKKKKACTLLQMREVGVVGALVVYHRLTCAQLARWCSSFLPSSESRCMLPLDALPWSSKPAAPNDPPKINILCVLHCLLYIRHKKCRLFSQQLYKHIQYRDVLVNFLFIFFLF